jgi:23S rRNA pseudouridine2605 synthase
MVDHAFDPTAPAPSGQDAAGLDGDGERVAKVLARAGVASRREVERLIEAGRVSLNGRVLKTPAVKIGPDDVLTVDGERIGAPEPARVWRYHKPNGLLTSHNDPKGRPTVFDRLPPELPRVISIGRLDLNSEGLLLLTNDGGLARALELPSNALVRRYRARARGHTTQAKLDRLKDGLTVDGVHYGAIEARLDKASESPTGANLWITLTLSEGKNREVRKVLEALGLTVNRLIRLSYGPFQLGVLPLGAVEEVGPRVIREQLGAFIAPENMPTGNQTITPTAAGPNAQAGAGRRAAGVLSDEAKKIEYKPGWARPKQKAGPPRPKRKPKAAAPSERKEKHWHEAGPAKPRGRTPERSDVKRSGAGPEARSDRKPAKPESPKAFVRPAKGSGAQRRGPPKGAGPKPRG